MTVLLSQFTRRRKLVACLLVALLGSWGSGEVRADLILTLSSANDFSNFAVGDTATFNVALSGVTVAEQPDFLQAAIGYDSTVLQVMNITSGAIVPDPAGFDSTGTSPGTVSATYDDGFVPSSPITTDGVFYSFQVTRLTGDGTDLFFASFSVQDDAGTIIALSATPNSFRVPAIRSVPEPSSILLTFLGAAAIAGGRSWHARRRPVSVPRRP